MEFIKKNPFFIAFFVLILGPTIMLSVFSFRYILNENLLFEKTFEERRQNFRKEVVLSVESEQNKILQDVRNAAVFLYEQPNNFFEFSKQTTFRKIKGVSSVFLFSNDTLIYPKLASLFYRNQKSFSQMPPTLIERDIFQSQDADTNKIIMLRTFELMHPTFTTQTEQSLNILGLVRLYYQKKEYEKALSLLDFLKENPNRQGYLHAKLITSIHLLYVDILKKQKKHREAENYVLNCLKKFLAGEDFGTISMVKYFFETTFDEILSFEDLSQKNREEFWNLRESLMRDLEHSSLLLKERQMIKLLKVNKKLNKDGFLYLTNGEDYFFKILNQTRESEHQIVGIFNRKEYEERLKQKILNVAKDFNDIPYAIKTSNDSVLVASKDSLSKEQLNLELGKHLHWQFILYEKDLKELKAKFRNKIFLMGALIIFSFITVAVGSIFMFRFLQQEKRLLAMKANFLSSISHELKTPLTSIKMFSEMIAKGRIKKTERIFEYANLITKETTRLENLIGAILNYTRMENGKQAFKWERLNLATAAENVFHAVESIAKERGLEIQKFIEPENFIIGDHTAIYSMFQNLIENAIKYTNSPGNIYVRVFKEGDFSVFEVEDTGIGIPLSEQKNIFNDFYRVGDEMTRTSKGSGLGLAIVKRAADAHKAVITLNSKLGKGSTFTIKFKRAD